MTNRLWRRLLIWAHRWYTSGCFLWGHRTDCSLCLMHWACTARRGHERLRAWATSLRTDTRHALGPPGLVLWPPSLGRRHPTKTPSTTSSTTPRPADRLALTRERLLVVRQDVLHHVVVWLTVGRGQGHDCCGLVRRRRTRGRNVRRERPNDELCGPTIVRVPVWGASAARTWRGSKLARTLSWLMPLAGLPTRLTGSRRRLAGGCTWLWRDPTLAPSHTSNALLQLHQLSRKRVALLPDLHTCITCRDIPVCGPTVCLPRLRSASASVRPTVRHDCRSRPRRRHSSSSL